MASSAGDLPFRLLNSSLTSILRLFIAFLFPCVDLLSINKWLRIGILLHLVTHPVRLSPLSLSLNRSFDVVNIALRPSVFWCRMPNRYPRNALHSMEHVLFLILGRCQPTR